jgi:hypothetical protein
MATVEPVPVEMVEPVDATPRLTGAKAAIAFCDYQLAQL